MTLPVTETDNATQVTNLGVTFFSIAATLLLTTSALAIPYGLKIVRKVLSMTIGAVRGMMGA